MHCETDHSGRDDNDRNSAFEESLIRAEQQYCRKDRDNEKHSPWD